MSRRRDPLTKDLFSWEPPKVAIGYSADVIGRGRLDAKIARLISHALRDAREEQGLSREDVAQQISDFLGRKVSVEMLYKWTSESSEDHRIPLDAFIALVHATGAKGLLGFVPGEFGLTVIENEYAELIEERLLEDHIEEMQARRQVLAARRKAKR
jgi:transcriptional regulator with XRE-family HTH domain